MRPQAHVAASLAIWSWGRAPLWEAPLDVIAGNLPDFDRSVAKALGVKRRDHHRWISHSPAGWLPVTAAVLALDRGPAARRALVALWSHLLLDSYADGIAWLWPVYKDKIGLFRGPPSKLDRGWRTAAPLTSRLGRVEAAMWASGALGLLLRHND